MDKRCYSAKDWQISRRMISANALEVVKVLRKHGYEAYLVGGCVRDLMLGLTPKDFDVATDAFPEQVRPLFRGARIIGRRFKIVHVNFGRGRQSETIEVSTYRALPSKVLKSYSKPQDAPQRIVDDNFYGDIKDDVKRRDFSVNALYYDPQEEVIVDFIDAVADINSRTLRVIGDTATRFIEDPVRILRVVRFQAKLDLHVSPAVTQCIKQCMHSLQGIPPARLFDELLKLLHHGYAQPTWEYLNHYDLLPYLLPCTHRFLIDDGHHRGDDTQAFIKRALGNTDHRVSQGLPIMPAFLLAVFLWMPLQQRRQQLVDQGVSPYQALLESADKLFQEQSRVLMIPWRVRTPVTEIWTLQYHLQRRNPKIIEKILADRRFRAAYDFMLLRSSVDQVDAALIDWWTEIQEVDSQQRSAMISVLKPPQGKRSRRRRTNRKMTQNS